VALQTSACSTPWQMDFYSGGELIFLTVLQPCVARLCIQSNQSQSSIPLHANGPQSVTEILLTDGLWGKIVYARQDKSHSKRSRSEVHWE
jgi:hypothetical protein